MPTLRTCSGGRLFNEDGTFAFCNCLEGPHVAQSLYPGSPSAVYRVKANDPKQRLWWVWAGCAWGWERASGRMHPSRPPRALLDRQAALLDPTPWLPLQRCKYLPS